MTTDAVLLLSSVLLSFCMHLSPLNSIRKACHVTTLRWKYPGQVAAKLFPITTCLVCGAQMIPFCERTIKHFSPFQL